MTPAALNSGAHWRIGDKFWNTETKQEFEGWINAQPDAGELATELVIPLNHPGSAASSPAHATDNNPPSTT